MEWLQKILKGIADGKTAEELQKEIQTEIPKYFKPADVFNTLNEKYKTLEGEKQTLEASQKSIQTEYENYKKGSISQADYEAKVQEIQENADNEIQKTKLDTAIDMYLMNAKARNVKSVKANLNLENVKQDGDTLIGIKEQVDKLIETDAYLFNIETKKNDGAGGGAQKRETQEEQDDELDDLSDEEYFAQMNNK